MNRRQLLAMLAIAARARQATAAGPADAEQATDAAPVTYPPVLPGRRLAFARDHGAHPDFRTEWWYLTGWLTIADDQAAAGKTPATAAPREAGFQLTFFRSRTTHRPDNPSRFAPNQLLFAHAALALPGQPGLLHDQRAARAGFGLAQAAPGDTDVSIADWSLRRTTDDHYRIRLTADNFGFALDLRPPGPPVLQGSGGYSRKGPRPEQASHYYSRPQLAVSGQLSLAAPARRYQVSGTGWLDHEWSSQLLDPQARGWDWVGLNFDDGQSLMAFRIRDAAGKSLWSDQTWIDRDGKALPAPPDTQPPVFEPQRLWRSPRTGVDYPVAMLLRAGGRSLQLLPLLDDQELDSRASTGTLYWEGAVRIVEGTRTVGRGYLELTGYGATVRF